MTKIVITAINTLRNRGVEALLLSIIDGLRTTIDAPQITLLTRDPDGARDSLASYDITITPDSAYAPFVDAPAFDKLKFRAKRAIRMKLLGKLTPAEQALAAADLVIVSGGDTFSSDYKIMERYLRQYDQVVARGTPLFFVAQSIGPFKTKAETDSFMGIAQHAHFTVRETISLAYMKKIGVPADRVSLTADPAFHLHIPDAARTDMMQTYGLSPKSYAACAFSRGISGFKGIGHEGHLAACVAATRFLIETEGKCVLVPHVQLPQDDEDDLSLARQIKAALNDDPACVVMDRLHTSREFKAVLAGANFVVAERTHGAIGAMSSGVPTLSVGYSIKAEGVLRQLITEDDLFAVSLLPVDKFTAGNAVAVTRAAYDRRADFAAALAQTLPPVRERSAQNFAKAAALVGQGG